MSTGTMTMTVTAITGIEVPPEMTETGIFSGNMTASVMTGGLPPTGATGNPAPSLQDRAPPAAARLLHVTAGELGATLTPRFLPHHLPQLPKPQP